MTRVDAGVLDHTFASRSSREVETSWLGQRRPCRDMRCPLPAPDVRGGRFRAAGHLGNLAELDDGQLWQGLRSEQPRVVDGAWGGLVPTRTAPDVGDDGTRLARPLHESTELPVGKARQGTEQRPCSCAGRRERRDRVGRDLCGVAAQTWPGPKPRRLAPEKSDLAANSHPTNIPGHRRSWPSAGEWLTP